MAAYRLYRVDSTGRFRSGEVVEAASDEQAIELSTKLLKDGGGELWLCGRMISRLGLSSRPQRAAAHPE